MVDLPPLLGGVPAELVGDQIGEVLQRHRGLRGAALRNRVLELLDAVGIPDRARRYHDGLYELFDLIAANPRLAAVRPEITPPSPVHPWKAHLVLYRQDPGGVTILRVRHHEEDWSDAPL